MLSSIKLELAGERYNVLSLEGTEGISLSFKFTIEMIVGSRFEPAQYLLQPAMLLMKVGKKYECIKVGVITQINHYYVGNSGEQSVKIVLQPRLMLASYAFSLRVLCDESGLDVIVSMLKQLGYQDDQIQLRLNKQYPKLPYNFQSFLESDHEFIQRLLVKLSIYYWFEVVIQSLHFAHLNFLHNND